MNFGTDVEFFHPFAHVPGEVEICRVTSPTHGVFDLLILIANKDTCQPVHVVTGSQNGVDFMHHYYPDSMAQLVPGLLLAWSPSMDHVHLSFKEADGPVTEVELDFECTPTAPPRAETYGCAETWGSPRRCDGVDLVYDSICNGHVIQNQVRVDWKNAASLSAVGSIGVFSSP